MIGAAFGMAAIVKGLDMFVVAPDSVALAVLIPAGIVSYAALCWMMNIADAQDRLRRGIAAMRDIRVRWPTKWTLVRRGTSVT